MQKIKEIYEMLSSTPSDINEHLPILFKYSQECNSVFETGVKGCNSTWALVYGLLSSPNKNNLSKCILLNDITECDIKDLIDESINEPIKIDYIWKNNLDVEFNKTYDLTFIDTWHVYGQLKRELEKFSKITYKYIIVRDSKVDEFQGETIHNGFKKLLESGIPLEEINKRMWPAIEEFLQNNHEWRLHERYTSNNSSLTILKRTQKTNRTKIHPISFSIPRQKILDETNNIEKKEKVISEIIPDYSRKYNYDSEEDYYNEYKKSLFALTIKKAGWDCMRHYEIIANGCIPYFLHIDLCPKNTMTHLPKPLLYKGVELYEKCCRYQNICEIPNNIMQECKELSTNLISFMKEHLTTQKMAEYILEKTDYKNVSNILYLSGCMYPDYLRCVTLHGFKEIFGEKCHDYPKVNHIYKSEPNNYKMLYGKGITYSNLIEHTFHDNELDKTIEDDILNHKYDIIIYGSYHRGMPYYNLVCSSYKPDEVILLCGEDLHNCDYEHYVKEGHHVFVREL